MALAKESDYGDSASVQPIDRTLSESGLREETPLLEPEENAAEEGERPHTELPQGYYIIEAIRAKRVRKGQKQYLIKWHNYHEKENTWEPMENLQEVSDIIDTFEESQSVKQRKRKHKHVTHSTQPKKRLQRSPTPYSLRCVTENGTNDHQQSASFVDVGHAELAAFPQDVLFSSKGQNNGTSSSQKGDEQHLEDGPPIVPRKTADGWEENDYDPKLGELKASSSMADNGIDADRLAILLGGSRASSDGSSNVDGREPVQNDRCKGAKKRKSGPVKRFIRESHVSEPVDTKRETDISVIAPTGNGNQVAEAEDKLSVVKIIKTIDCLPPELTNTKEALVTFIALRSDGAEVVVNNRILKASNPLLLINFYEQHLRYNRARVDERSNCGPEAETAEKLHIQEFMKKDRSRFWAVSFQERSRSQVDIWYGCWKDEDTTRDWGNHVCEQGEN
ncbi:hypothetical protein L6164_002786 [Bauhinia variegata]|uniref:Uncharacterized protein n=1 Tax=Bauhinia variegata TaxID=167791 RepID=A0ACB9PZD7_BAUVA|nr:hypothetical protein L6164_002786 [Bauhinia variegata]